MNIVEPILYNCKLNPWDVAICVPGSALESITYGRLEKLIHNIARTALSGDLRPGDLVAIRVHDNILHAALIYGLMRVGIASVSILGTSIPRSINVDAIVTDAPRQFDQGEKVVAVDSSWISGDGKPPNYDRLAQLSDNDLCRITLTSGSASEPKGIALTNQSLWGKITRYFYAKGSGFQNGSRLFCDLGIASSPGFRYATYMLLRGGTIYFLGDEPSAILQFLYLHKIQGMATSPHGLGEFMQFFEKDSQFDCEFNYIICQGAMLSRELSERVRARMCQNLFSSYGATETGTVAFGPASVLADIPGAVGYVGPGVTVEALSEAGEVLPAGQEGELRIRTPYLAEGYVGDEEATKQAFRDGFFHSGDIGQITADGIMIVSGRKKAILNLGGASVNPERIEAVLNAYVGVREAAALSLDNELGIAEAYALIVADVPIDEAAIVAYCQSSMPSHWQPRRIFQIDQLPKGGQGKLERHRLHEIAKMRLAESSIKPG